MPIHLLHQFHKILISLNWCRGSPLKKHLYLDQMQKCRGPADTNSCHSTPLCPTTKTSQYSSRPVLNFPYWDTSVSVTTLQSSGVPGRWGRQVHLLQPFNLRSDARMDKRAGCIHCGGNDRSSAKICAGSQSVSCLWRLVKTNKLGNISEWRTDCQQMERIWAVYFQVTHFKTFLEWKRPKMIWF